MAWRAALNSITTDALSLGEHVVVARAEDDARNVSAQSGPITVRIVDAPCNAPNRIVGNERPNLLVGTGGADVMLGLGGTDGLFGLGGADCLSGGAGDDILAGGSGDDESAGGDGRDYIDPGPGRDLVSGGSATTAWTRVTVPWTTSIAGREQRTPRPSIVSTR